MKKLRLKRWVETLLIAWATIDIFLIAIALYFERLVELGWI